MNPGFKRNLQINFQKVSKGKQSYTRDLSKIQNSDKRKKMEWKLF